MSKTDDSTIGLRLGANYTAIFTKSCRSYYMYLPARRRTSETEESILGGEYRKTLR